MKIVKLIHEVAPKNTYPKEHFSVIFDEIPRMTYEKIGSDFVGSAVDSEGNVIFSEFLQRKRWGDAFGGRELWLPMKDGTWKVIKDYWFAMGAYPEHGSFISIGAGTLEGLQDCFVFSGMSINRKALQAMIDEYLRFDRTYTHDELREWSRLQYEWYPVRIGEETLPLMVNKVGDFVTVSTKEQVFPRTNYLRTVRGRCFQLCYFKYEYHNGDRLVKYTNTVLNVLRDSLPYTDKEIIANAKLSLGKF